MSAIQTIRKTIDGLDEISGIIANPSSGGPVREAIGNTGRRVCDAYGNLELVSPLLFGPAGAVIDLVCKPYFDGQGFDGPELAPPPFTGGQCQGVLYQFKRTGTDSNGTPISENQYICSGQYGGPLSLVKEGSASTAIFALYSTRLNGTIDRTVLFTGPNTPQINVTIKDVLRCDEQADNCGDPPTELQPGTNPPPSPGPFPTGEEPGVDPDGQPFFFIPDILVPGFDPLPLDDEPLGDAPPPPPPPAGGDGLPGDPAAISGEAGEVSGGDDGEDIDFGEPPEGRVWIGCIVETSSIPALGNIAGTGPLSTVWPTVRANASLNYGSKKGSNNRINSKFHDLIRPATSLIVTGVFLQVLPGSTAKVFPLSALKCPENPCED